MANGMAKVLPGDRLTLKDRLSRLSFIDACKLLGPEGKQLIQRNANGWEFDLQEDVYLGDDLFRLRFPSYGGERSPIVTITLMAEARQRLHYRCDECDGAGTGACDHAGAAFSFVLENKLNLGLAAPPPEREPVASLAEEDLVARAIAERADRAKAEKMNVQSTDPTQPWTDYTVTNRLSGKTYRVALRGLKPGDSYCTCPDFRTNTLGTCKHVLKVVESVKRKFPAARLRRAHRPRRLAGRSGT